MSQNATVLVVDDNTENIRVLGTLLRNHHYRVIVAQTGSQALKILELTTPDLILLDIVMPDIDGFEVCKRIKNDEHLKSIPVIFLTAKDDDEDLVFGFNIGAVDYVTKPFKDAVLLARVKTHVQLFQAQMLLREQAFLDGLTQIPNRFYFEKVFLKEWNRAKRSKANLALIMLDIDYFKRLNDDYGHLEGDYALKKVASSLHNLAKRAGDFVARYGGEEFVVILPNTRFEGALQLAESMRQAVLELDIKNKNTALGKVSISLGVASVKPDNNLSEIELINQADNALYFAKSNGRNQVSSFSLKD